MRLLEARFEERSARSANVSFFALLRSSGEALERGREPLQRQALGQSACRLVRKALGCAMDAPLVTQI